MRAQLPLPPLLLLLLHPALTAAKVVYTHSKTGEEFDVEARCGALDGGYFNHGTAAQRECKRNVAVLAHWPQNLNMCIEHDADAHCCNLHRHVCHAIPEY